MQKKNGKLLVLEVGVAAAGMDDSSVYRGEVGKLCKDFSDGCDRFWAKRGVATWEFNKHVHRPISSDVSSRSKKKKVDHASPEVYTPAL